MAPVPEIWTTVDWFACRFCHVGTISILTASHNIELYGSAFVLAPFDLLQVVPSDHSPVNKDILAGVIATDETISVLDVIPFNRPKNSLAYATAQTDKAVLHLVELFCGLPVSSQVMLFSCLLAWNGLDKPNPLHAVFLESLQPNRRRWELVLQRKQVEPLVSPQLNLTGSLEDDQLIITRSQTLHQFRLPLRQWQGSGLSSSFLFIACSLPRSSTFAF